MSGYPEMDSQCDQRVVNVSWEDDMKPGGFCDWVTTVAGFKATLPTDAQFEYAARGGKVSQDYPSGKHFDESMVWCGRMGTKTTGAVTRTDHVFRNAFGIVDIVGKVRQWCADYYNLKYVPSGKDSIDSQFSRSRTFRGSSWQLNLSRSPIDQVQLWCSFRSGMASDDTDNEVGFRLVAPPK